MATKLASYQIRHAAEKVATTIMEQWGEPKEATIQIYGVPRGGIPAAYAVAAASNGRIQVIDNPDNAFAIVDDLIDSGATMEKWVEKIAPCNFYALFDKREGPYKGEWLVFPWEESEERGVEDHIVRMMQFMGEDTNREGLKETPARVAKAWKFWCSGYGKKPQDILKVFADGAKGVDEMVVVKDIPFYSHCEHHLAPFFGTATVAYIPNGKIVGLSKLSRLVDIYARRLQVQERLTNEVADAILEHLQPLGVGVTLKARHLCMESRGVSQQGHHTITSALRGVIKEDAKARAEFMGLSR